MMSAVGLELTNFIDPDLTWKTVTKGYRSASRRKPVARSFNVKNKLSDESTRNVDDMTVSDTEKYGVAVLGRRFSGKNEKNEHVPIKKRRFTAQGPPQPARTTSPRIDVLEPNSSGKRRRRATDAAVPTKLSLKTSEVTDKFDYSDDFSGIEILAAVACNNVMINDSARDEESSIMEESTREGVGSSSSAVPFKETAASPKDMVHEDKPEAFQNSEVTVLHDSARDEESSIMEESTREGVGSSSSAVPFKETAASPKDMAPHEDKPEAFQNREVTVLHASACDEECSIMEESTREGVGSSSSAVPFKETAASPKDMAPHEDKLEAFQNSEVTVLHASACDEECSIMEESTREGVGSSSSAVPFKETAASPKDMAPHEDKLEAFQNSEVTVLHASACDEECSIMEESTREGVGSSSSAVPFKETAASPKDMAPHEDKLEAFQNSEVTVLHASACDEECSIMEESTREGVGSSSSAVPFKETAASPKDMAHEDKLEAFQNSEVTVLHTSAGTKDSGTGEGSLLSRDEMLNLDLNVTWEQPCDTSSFDSSENDLQSCEVKREALEQHNPPDRVVLSDLLRNNTSVDLIGLSLGTCESSREEPKSEACFVHDGKHSSCFPSPTGNALESSICDVVNAQASSQIVYGDESLDHPLCNTLPSLTLKQCSEMCSSDDQIGKVLCSESVQVESCDVSPHHRPNLERVPCEINLSISNDKGENSQIASRPHEDGKLNKSSLENCPPIGPAWLGVESGGREEESGDQHCTPNSRDIYASRLPAERGQPMMEVDANGANEASAANKAEVHSPVQARSEELMQKSSADSTVTPGDACRTHGNGFTSGPAKVNVEDLEVESFESDVYQADKVHIVGTKNDLELQAGYDSQFEDGELRESDAQYYWDENGEDGEVEHVDYGSECDEERLCGLDNEKEMKIERGSSSGSDYVSRKIEQCGMGDSPRDDSVSPKTRTSDVSTDKDFLSGVVGSRASNRVFLSSIEESNAIFRKDPALRSRANNFYSLYPRDERDAGSQKFMGRDRTVPQIRGRSPGGHRFVNSATGYCDSERRYFCTYRDNYTSGPSRTRGGFDSRRYVITSDHTDSEGAGFAGSDNRARRRFVNPSSTSAYERISRRRSPTSRDDVYRVHTGALPVRDGSPVRSGFRRFPRGVATGGLRGEYHRSMPEDKIEYSNRYAPRMLRRERSISPLCRGQPCYPFTHKKSRSRSRSRSPSYLPRDRNDISRVHSRSPDCRTDARMDRVRLPFQKRFPSDFEEGFMHTRRNHFTQRNPRWFDDRHGGLDSFRGRKSPVNMFRSNQRFDSVRTIRRLDSEDQFRQMIRSRKFDDTGSASRGGEFDGSDDDNRRKHSNRYEMVQRARRYDTDGGLRRFRFKAEDSLVANNDNPNCEDGNRITDRRPGEALRRDGEE